MTIDGIVIRTNMAEKELICNSFSGKLRNNSHFGDLQTKINFLFKCWRRKVAGKKWHRQKEEVKDAEARLSFFSASPKILQSGRSSGPLKLFSHPIAQRDFSCLEIFALVSLIFKGSLVDESGWNSNVLYLSLNECTIIKVLTLNYKDYANIMNPDKQS